MFPKRLSKPFGLHNWSHGNHEQKERALEHSFQIIELGGHESHHIQKPNLCLKTFYQTISLKSRKLAAIVTETFLSFQEIIWKSLNIDLGVWI